MSIVKDRVVAIGWSRVEAYEVGREKYPKEKVAIFFLYPTEKETVPLL